MKNERTVNEILREIEGLTEAYKSNKITKQSYDYLMVKADEELRRLRG